MKTEFKVGENGKPRVNFSKEYGSLTQFDRITGDSFNIEKVTLFLSESKINSPIKVTDRSFIFSMRQDGKGKDKGKYKNSQMQFNKVELGYIRDSINKMLEWA